MARYAEVLFRHRIRFTSLFLIPVALAAGVAVGLASYRATASLSVADPSSFGATFVPVGWSANATPAQNVADAAALVVKTPAFSQALSDGLSSSSPSLGSANVQQAVTSIGSNLKIGVSGSHLVTLSYTCHTAAVCVQVLSATVTALHQQLIQSERNQAEATTAFWTAQLQDSQTNLTSAQADLQKFAAANRGMTVDSTSTDSRVVLLLDRVKQWQAKVVEARDNLSLAQYTSSASARLMEIGTSVVTAPELATTSLAGDGSSAKFAALVLALGLALGLAYLVALTWVDKTARDPRALEHRLGVPVVATIPKLVSSRGF